MTRNPLINMPLAMVVAFSGGTSIVAGETIDRPISSELRTIGRIKHLDPRLDAIVPQAAVLQILADGHKWTEGPVWVPSLQALLYSDIPRNAIYRWSEGDKASLWLQPSGYTGPMGRGGAIGSNGLLLDTVGRLVLAQHGDRRIARLETPLNEPKAVFSTLTAKFEGKRYNSPNDIAIRSNGDLYFTDPPYGLEHGVDDPAREMQTQGVYRLTTDATATLLTDELSRPNGGGAVIFDRPILHSATSNTSEVCRKAIFYGYSYRWLHPRDDQSVAHLIEDCDPIRQQLLGHGPTGGFGYTSPSEEDVPLREWIREHVGEEAITPRQPA